MDNKLVYGKIYSTVISSGERKVLYLGKSPHKRHKKNPHLIVSKRYRGKGILAYGFSNYGLEGDSLTIKSSIANRKISPLEEEFIEDLMDKK